MVKLVRVPGSDSASRPGQVGSGWVRYGGATPVIILLRDPRVDPLSLFPCRMTRGQKKTSTN